jgi:hypothetical protein
MGHDMTRRDLLKDLALASSLGAAGLGGANALAVANGQPLNTRVDAWRKMFASLRDEEEVCCWYMGTMFVRPQGVPEIPVMHAETIMVYRASAAADGSTRMRWIEIGRFRDALTGEATQNWLNPITGRRVPMPKSFITKASEYHVRSGADTLAVRLDQHDARVESVEAQIRAEGARVWVQQTERKVRGVAATATAAEVVGHPKSLTKLAISADRREIDDPNCLSATASGSYSFETDALPAWAGFEVPGSTIVRGLMQKAATDVPVSAQAWQALRALYPQFFSGDKVAPRWD